MRSILCLLDLVQSIGLLGSLENVLVFFKWVRKRIVTTSGMLEKR
jgi:hypothetical protein